MYMRTAANLQILQMRTELGRLKMHKILQKVALSQEKYPNQLLACHIINFELLALRDRYACTTS